MATSKATPAKATQPTPSDDDQPVTHVTDASDASDASDALTGDLMTVLRHLVSNQQWGGNTGARAECEEALDRLMDSTRK
jgi:hypothetical protein